MWPLCRSLLLGRRKKPAVPISFPSSNTPITKLLAASFLLKRSLVVSTVVSRCSSAESAKDAGSLCKASRRRCQKASASSAVRRRISTMSHYRKAECQGPPPTQKTEAEPLRPGLLENIKASSSERESASELDDSWLVR